MNIKIRDKKNESFYYHNKLICKKQCKVFIDGKDKGVYGYPTKEEIYESIKVKKEIYFPNCLIPEFIITKELTNKDKRIKLKKIDLTLSIFSEYSHYQFNDIDIKGIINFRGAFFYGANCLFEKCNFEAEYKGNPIIDFTSIECKRAYIRFDVSIIDSHLDFTGSTYQDSIIDFNKINIQHLTNKVSYIQVNLRFYGATLDNRSRIRIISSKIETELDLRFYD